VHNFSGIVAARFILGLVEAPFFPGSLFYLSKWYTKEELAKRNAIFYAGSLVSGAFGSLIAAGILSGLDGHLGLAAWKWYVNAHLKLWLYASDPCYPSLESLA
jgi:MFS family permease